MNDVEEMRQGVYDAPVDIKPITTPFWPALDGKVGISDLSTEEFDICQNLSGTPNYGATLVCYTLVNRVTGERFLGKYNEQGVFVPTDRDQIKKRLRVVAQLVPQIRKFLNGTIEEKKDISTVQKEVQTSSGTD